jgi:osmotically-inducible protein OsmY
MRGNSRRTKKPPEEEEEEGGWGDRLGDLETETTIQAALIAIAPSTGLRVDVDADSGIVYLRGEVATREQRALAERTVRDMNVEGVRRIENELVVNPSISQLPHP